MNYSCSSGKVYFTEVWHAQLGALAAANRTGMPMSYYRCPECRLFHITHSSGGRRTVRPSA